MCENEIVDIPNRELVFLCKLPGAFQYSNRSFEYKMFLGLVIHPFPVCAWIFLYFHLFTV